MTSRPHSDIPTRFAFLLLRDFTLISLSCCIEPLRMANRVHGADTFAWKTISEDGRAVPASDGLSVNVDCAMQSEDALSEVDAVLVCGGLDIDRNSTAPVLRWLNRVHGMGLALGATCTGSVTLARAGLLDGRRCSVHWEHMASMAEQFNRVRVSRSIYSIDGKRYTSAGGTSPIDMMMYFISQHCGAEVCAGVAEQFIRERIRTSEDQQRVPLRHSIGHRSKKLVVAVELMEANVREPISQEELANYVGVTKRQLQRLFQRYLDCTPSRYYVQLRLQRARDLLLQTSMNMVEISVMTGFISPSHFSKCYKNYYGYPPTVERQRAMILVPGGKATDQESDPGTRPASHARS